MNPQDALIGQGLNGKYITEDLTKFVTLISDLQTGLRPNGPSHILIIMDHGVFACPCKIDLHNGHM